MMPLPCYLVFLLTFSVMLTVKAQETRPDVVQQIFTLSGLGTQIDYLPETIEDTIATLLEERRKKKQISAKTVQQLLDLVRQSFVVEDMSDIILAHMDKQLTANNTSIILQWLNSKLGRQLTYLEKRSTQAAQMAKMRQYVRNLDNSPVNPKRLNLITQLNQATQAAKSTLIVVMASKLAVELTKLQFLAASNRPNLVSVMERIALQQIIVEEEITSMVINGLLFTYQYVSDEDLQTYIDFANSPVGNRYHEVLLGAYNSALLDASNRFGQAIYGKNSIGVKTSE